MRYCENCDTEYEVEEGCTCNQYRRWMEDGQTYRVPMRWKIDNWDGYLHAPEYCDHVDMDPADAPALCNFCGSKVQMLF